jgi:hypothetical protein
MAEILPFQDGGDILEDQHGSTEIVQSSGIVESTNHWVAAYNREVFMAPERGRSPLCSPTPPDENSVDERLSNISPDA